MLLMDMLNCLDMDSQMKVDILPHIMKIRTHMLMEKIKKRYGCFIKMTFWDIGKLHLMYHLV